MRPPTLRGGRDQYKVLDAAILTGAAGGMRSAQHMQGLCRFARAPVCTGHVLYVYSRPICIIKCRAQWVGGRNACNPVHSSSSTLHPGGNPGVNFKSICRRFYLILVAFVGELTKETIYSLLGASKVETQTAELLIPPLGMGQRRLRGRTHDLTEKSFNSKLSGNEVYCTNALLFGIQIMLC